jgi:uncharacterized protein (DUF433 family)
MTDASTSGWIVTDPDVLGGKPRIRGTRISVAFVLELLASGASREDVLRGYPQVTEEGLAAALSYAARAMANDAVWDVRVPGNAA